VLVERRKQAASQGEGKYATVVKDRKGVGGKGVLDAHLHTYTRTHTHIHTQEVLQERVEEERAKVQDLHDRLVRCFRRNTKFHIFWMYFTSCLIKTFGSMTQTGNTHMHKHMHSHTHAHTACTHNHIHARTHNANLSAHKTRTCTNIHMHTHTHMRTHTRRVAPKTWWKRFGRLSTPQLEVTKPKVVNVNRKIMLTKDTKPTRNNISGVMQSSLVLRECDCHWYPSARGRMQSELRVRGSRASEVGIWNCPYVHRYL